LTELTLDAVDLVSATSGRVSLVRVSLEGFHGPKTTVPRGEVARQAVNNVAKYPTRSPENPKEWIDFIFTGFGPTGRIQWPSHPPFNAKTRVRMLRCF
jgi:hypothetical protein